MENIPRHIHNGIDSEQIQYKDLINLNKQSLTASDGTLANAVTRLAEIEAILKSINIIK